MLQLRRVRLLEYLFGLVSEFLHWRLPGQAPHLVFLQFARILIPALLEEAAQQEIVLERVHVFVESSGSGFGLSSGGASLLVDSPVVDKRSQRALHRDTSQQ